MSNPPNSSNSQDQLLQDASTLLMFANVAAKQQQEIRQNTPSPPVVPQLGSHHPVGSGSFTSPQAPLPPQPATQSAVSQPPYVKHPVFDPVRQIYINHTPYNHLPPHHRTALPPAEVHQVQFPSVAGQTTGAAAVPSPPTTASTTNNINGTSQLGPPSSSVPVSTHVSAHSSVSEPGSKEASLHVPAHRRTSSVPSTTVSLTHALSPGPASVVLARGSSNGTNNNSIIAAAALAQAADNPLPLLKHEEAVRREIKHEVIKSPVVADKAGVKTEKKPEVPEQEPVVPKSEPVVHKQEHVVHKQEHVVHKQEHVVHKQEHVVPGKKPEIPEVVAPTPHNDDKPLVSKDYVAPPLSEYKVEPDSGVIGCICGISDDDGFTIQCDICYRWQHCLCMDYSTNEEVPEDEYKCYFCDKEKWGKFDPEQCRHNTVTRLQQDNDNQDVSTSKPGNKRKVSTSGRVGDKKKSRLNPNQERPKDRRKQLRDDFSNPTSAVDEIPDFIPNEDNELLDDGYTAESYQSTYYKLRSNDYLNHQSQKHFEDLGDRFYDSFQQLSEDEKEKLNIEVVTLKNFKAIPRMYVKLPNHETHMQAHNKPIKIPNVYIQVKQYSDSQKQKFNGISKLSLFVQAQREGSKEAFEDLIPKGTPILEYFGVLNEFSQYRDNKPNQYNVWGTTKPKVLKTSLSFIDKGKQIKDFDVVLDSRFVGNETRFIRKACPPAANCEVKAFYIPEAKSFRFLVVTSKDIKLDQETSEEELRLPWEWDEAHPIRKMYGDESKNIEGLKFDQLSDKEKTLLITTIDNLLYFTECGCSTTTNTPSYLPNCAVFKVRKAISYLLRATRKVSGIINVNMYKPKDELIIPKEPKTYVPWEQRLHNREEFIQTKLFVPTPTKVIKFDDDEEVSRDTIKDIIIKNQLVKLTDNSVEVIDGKYHNDKVLDLVPISTGISAKVEKTVEAEVQVKPEIKKSLSELKLKLTDNNLTKINKVLNLNLEKRVTPPPIPAEPSEKPMVKKKLSFADYKKKMK